MKPRHRTSGGLLTPGNTLYQVTNQNVQVWTKEPIPNYSARQMDDVTVDNYHQRVKQGEVFFNPMTSWEISRTFSEGGAPLVIDGPGYKWYYEVYYPQQGWTYNEGAAWVWTLHGNLLHVVEPDYVMHIDVHFRDSVISAEDVAALQAESATACHASRGSVANSNTWESVAEIGKTIQMLRHPIQTFLKFDKGFAIKKFGSATQSWLAYRYGIKPLISNVEEVLKSVEKMRGSQRFATRNQRKLRQDSNETKVVRWNGLDITLNVAVSHEVIVRSVSLDEVSLSALDHSGLSTKQLLQVPWELVPYSFVVDWFVNAGDFISAHLPTPGWKNLGSCQTVEHVITKTVSISDIAYPPSSQYNENSNMWGLRVLSWSSGSCVYKLKYKTRTTLPAPSLSLSSDLSRGGIVRIADGLSLVAQQVLKHSRAAALLDSPYSKLPKARLTGPKAKRMLK